MTPFRPCAHFESVVKFHPDRLPDRVQRLDGLPTAAFTEPMPAIGTIEPEPEPVMHTEFDGLIPGLGYGLRWG